MSAIVKQVNLITLKLDMLKDERRLFMETLDAYFNQVIYLGQSFVDNPSNSLLNFKDISLSVESALSFLGEKTAEFKTKLKQKSGLIGHELHSDFETSDSVSFEILQQSPSRFAELKTHSQATDQTPERTEFLEKQLKSNSVKLETLSTTLIRVIADLNSLKRLGNGDGFKVQNAEGDGRASLGLEQSETFVEMKKNYSSLTSDLESISKRYEFIMKEFSASKCENGQQMNVLEKRLNDLESRGSKTEIRSSDVENKVCRLEDSHSKIDHKINSLENRLSKMDNRLNETDTRVSQYELRTCAVIGEKEAEMRDLSDRLRQTVQDILAIKQVTNERKEMDLAKLTEIEDCVKSLQKNCAKLDLEAEGDKT
ncbi:unnamed protein product [Lymnaea stagnalis]|uniref:Uncharacterized protein n=1 Tax=Lymnaea stagnalis TaxID=6523 RepID=A0AAV2HQR8_LYMST